MFNGGKTLILLEPKESYFIQKLFLAGMSWVKGVATRFYRVATKTFTQIMAEVSPYNCDPHLPYALKQVKSLG